jgi:hypothetical protein
MGVMVEVYRGAGDRPGGEIREPLLGTSLEAALARGLAELDQRAHSFERVTLDTDYRPELTLGAVVEVDDPLQGIPWRGQVIGVQHRFSDNMPATVLTVRRAVA